MPEGDTLHRTAAGLRPHLLGRVVTAARVRLPGPQAERLVGRTVTDVEAYGKHLLIRFDSGLELRSHLGMPGSWHRYAPGERGRRPPARARFVMEVPGAVAVCFDAPVLELFETRVEAIHPVLARLGPDLLAEDFGPDDVAEALRRLRDSEAARRSIAEGLLDQRALAGIGNDYKNEVLFIERVDPFAPVEDLDDDTLTRLITTARRLMRANLGTVDRRTTERQASAGGQSAWVYRRAGRPCRRCGTLVAVRRHGELPRSTYWCANCQAARILEPARVAESATGRRDTRHTMATQREASRP
jgi:endonuclease-8